MKTCQQAFLLALALWGLAGLPDQALADDGSPVVLRVYGSEGEGSEPMAVFTKTDLEQMPLSTIRTETIWTEGVQEFAGVSLLHLVNVLGISSGLLEASAANEYLIDIPVSDAVINGPIIAYQRNGVPMSVRDKGPLWVIYPYDSDPKYKSEEVYARSVWQLTHMTVLPEN